MKTKLQKIYKTRNTHLRSKTKIRQLKNTKKQQQQQQKQNT